MDFYITDRKYNLLAIASTDGTGEFGISDDVDTEMVPQSVGRSYTGTINFVPAQIETAKKLAETGNYMLYQDERGRYMFATMMETELNALNCTIDFTAENGGVDLINETVGAYKAVKAMTIAEYLAVFTFDSGFEIGLNEVPTRTRTLEWTSEETALARVKAVAADFDVELDFRFDIDGTQVVKRYIDIHQKIGADKAQRLEVNTHINSIVTTSNIYDLYTSVIASGDTAEGSDQPITLAGYKWTDPDGRYTLDAGGTLRDTVAVQLWSRSLSNDIQHPTGNHIQRVKTYTAKSQAELLQSALSDLKKYNHATVNYTVSLAYLPDNIAVGDTVHLVDEEQGLNLSARLLELKTSYANGTHEATFGDYLIEANAIDPELRDLANTVKVLSASAKQFPWVRYADDDQGNGISELPADKSYMAVVWGKTATPSDDPADYAGKWQKVKGDDGVGVAGPKGDDGKTSYFHTAYADDVNGGGFSQSPTGKAYIGTYSDFTEADSTTASDYTWALIKGADGADGKDGEEGPAGKDGAQGPAGQDITSYASGTTIPTTIAPANSQFWLLDSAGIAIKFYKSNGNKWVEQPISASAISAANFNGLTFNGVTFNGSEFISSFKNAPVDESDFADVTDPTGQIMLTKGTGTTKMGDGYLTVDGTIDGSSGDSLQTFHTEVGPAGLLSRLYTGGTAENNISAAAQLYLGQLLLSNLDSSGKKVSGHLNGEMLQQLDNSGLMLWSGAMGMTPGQHIRPTIPLSETMVGWMLVWSQYDTGANAAIDRNFLYTLIHKSRGFDKNGKGIMIPINMPTKGNFAQVVFANDTDIVGDGNNNGSLQHNVVLRYIYAV